MPTATSHSYHSYLECQARELHVVLKVFNMNLDVWHISTPLETIFTAF